MYIDANERARVNCLIITHGKRLKSIGFCLTLDNWIIKINAYIASLKAVLDVKQKQNE